MHLEDVLQYQYHLAGLVTVLPFCYVGVGKLVKRRAKRRKETTQTQTPFWHNKEQQEFFVRVHFGDVGNILFLKVGEYFIDLRTRRVWVRWRDGKNDMILHLLRV